MKHFLRLCVFFIFTLICCCENRGSGSPVYKRFNPINILSEVSVESQLELTLTDKVISRDNELNHGKVYWRFYSMNKADDLPQFALKIRDRLLLSLQDLGAITEIGPVKTGSKEFCLINYTSKDRVGWLDIEVENFHNRTEITIVLRERDPIPECSE